MMLFTYPEILIFKVLRVYLAYEENRYKFRKHPKIKWLNGGLEPPTSELSVQCFTKSPV